MSAGNPAVAAPDDRAWRAAAQGRFDDLAGQYQLWGTRMRACADICEAIATAARTAVAGDALDPATVLRALVRLPEAYGNADMLESQLQNDLKLFRRAGEVACPARSDPDERGPS